MNILLDICTMLAGIAAAATMFHLWRHRRDDKVLMSASVEDGDETYVNIRGCACWRGTVRIANVGRRGVQLLGLEIVGDDLAKAVGLSVDPPLNVYLDEGAMVECKTVIHAVKPGLPLPERIALACKGPPFIKQEGTFVVEPAKASTAG